MNGLVILNVLSGLFVFSMLFVLNNFFFGKKKKFKEKFAIAQFSEYKEVYRNGTHMSKLKKQSLLLVTVLAFLFFLFYILRFASTLL